MKTYENLTKNLQKQINYQEEKQKQKIENENSNK